MLETNLELKTCTILFRISSNDSDSASIDNGWIEDLTCQLAIKDREVCQLMADLQNAKSTKETEIVALQKSLNDLEQEKSELTKKLESFSLKLESQSDYTSIKKDLTILKVFLIISCLTWR